MNILIIGGGVFLGAAALQAALARQHRVTVFNRGRACSAWSAGVEVLIGDRSTDLDPLRGRRWDAVIDTCGYAPADVRRSCEALRGCGCCLFVSSISAYASTQPVPVRETDPLASFAGIAADDRNLQHYGAQKAACEAEVSRVFQGRSLLVRPGLIVGPGDRTGRFSHWPWRTMAGGEMLVPDLPAGEPLQFIDVRDLGAWLVHLLEQQARGAFNATGPVTEPAAGAGPPAPACDWPTLLRACLEEARLRTATPAQPVLVSEDFLAAQQVAPWSELPLWLPSADAQFAGFNRVALDRAAAAGVRTRPLRETIAAVMDEGLPAADDPRRAGKLTREREAGLLARWRAP